ncbi:MAG: SRPBCC domain-containing protein [Nitriliruptor sp.]|nr:MAG: SRPBCC domain-containing protein [Nitriliruptor sp.]
MPIVNDDDGRRSVEASVEVPGSPDQVWQAIATGPGVSSWFVPTTSEERVGGTVVSSFGPGMDAEAQIIAWDPPKRFSAESVDDTGQGPSTVATEWIVETRGGGTCVARVVHRWFADSDEWDGQFEAHAYGWASTYFRMLRLYLTHFRARTCSAFDLAAISDLPPAETWRTLKQAVTIDEAAQRADSAGGAPELSGTIESTEITDPDLLTVRDTSPLVKATLEGLDGEDPNLLLRLDEPAPGLAHLFVMPTGEQTMVSVRFFLYGERGMDVASDTEGSWSDWLHRQFPQQEAHR